MCNCRDATGKFPDFPELDEGGSEVIFKKKEPEVGIVLYFYMQSTVLFIVFKVQLKVKDCINRDFIINLVYVKNIVTVIFVFF